MTRTSTTTLILLLFVLVASMTDFRKDQIMKQGVRVRGETIFVYVQGGKKTEWKRMVRTRMV